MAQNTRAAVNMVEAGHVRVGPEMVLDPAFLVPRLGRFLEPNLVKSEGGMEGVHAAMSPAISFPIHREFWILDIYFRQFKVSDDKNLRKRPLLKLKTTF